jgi:hypothetical protein
VDGLLGILLLAGVLVASILVLTRRLERSLVFRPSRRMSTFVRRMGLSSTDGSSTIHPPIGLSSSSTGTKGASPPMPSGSSACPRSG